MTTTQFIIIAAIVSFIVAVTVSTIAMLTLQHAPLESDDSQPKYKDLGMVACKYEYDTWFFETMGECVDMANKRAQEGWRLVKIHQLDEVGKPPYKYWIVLEREIG